VPGCVALDPVLICHITRTQRDARWCLPGCSSFFNLIVCLASAVHFASKIKVNRRAPGFADEEMQNQRFAVLAVSIQPTEMALSRTNKVQGKFHGVKRDSNDCIQPEVAIAVSVQ
jgi:hypothetical protein